MCCCCRQAVGHHGDKLDDGITMEEMVVIRDMCFVYRPASIYTALVSRLTLTGFIIVATCVLTFEARDSAAKVGPASYSGGRSAAALYTNPYRARARSLDVRSVASQTMDEPTSTTATTTSFTALHIFDKKSLFETFKKFSRFVLNMILYSYFMNRS